MVKLHLKRLAALCLGIILLIGCIFYSSLINKPGVDYTESYGIYNDLKELSSIKDVESYLDNKNISYEIEKNKLTLLDYDSIEYIINPDNQTGYITHSNIMYNLSKLDERNLDIIYVKKEIINENYVEAICLEKDGFIYTKVNDNYYVEPTIFYLILIVVTFIASIIILPLITIEYIGVFFDWLKERKTKKDIVNKDSTNDLKNNCKS